MKNAMGDFGNFGDGEVSDNNIVGVSPDGVAIEASIDNGTLSLEEVVLEEVFIFTKKYKFGDTGDDIIELQKHLSEYGYYADEQDGIYGFQTLMGVKDFQRSNALPPNGQVDADTFNLLYNPPDDVKIINKKTESDLAKSSSNKKKLIGGAAAIAALYFMNKE